MLKNALFLLSICSFLAACSSTPLKKEMHSLEEKFLKKQESSAEIRKALAPLCLNGIGKGRIIFRGGDRLHFTFESKHSTKDAKLLLSVDIPFHGEELLILNYDRQVRLSGTISKLLEAQPLALKQKIKTLAQLFATILKFQKDLKANPQKCYAQHKVDRDTLGGQCGSQQWRFSDEKLTLINQNSFGELQFYGSQKNDLFEMLNFKMQYQDNKNNFELSLLFQECEK